MSTSHTPGPWKLNGRIVQTDEKSGFCIAEIFGGFGKPLEKNGMLIAAAPDLLKALMRLENAMSKPAHDAERPNALNQARVAIAKATGGSP